MANEPTILVKQDDGTSVRMTLSEFTSWREKRTGNTASSVAAPPVAAPKQNGALPIIDALPEKVEPFYQDICDALLVSQAVIGTKENASYSVQKFVKEVLEGKQMTKGSAMLWYNDHVEVATLFDQEIYTQDLLIAVDEIVEMIAFCLVVPKNFVWNYVDTYGRPEEIQYRTLHNMLGSPLELEDSFKAFNDTLLRSTPKPNVAKQSDIEKTSDTDFIPNDVLLGTTESLRSTLEWLKGFESPKLAWNALQERIKEQVVSLDFESANAIMQLSFFLKQNGYADQPDIVYYDQSSNNFHWNQ